MTILVALSLDAATSRDNNIIYTSYIGMHNPVITLPSITLHICIAIDSRPRDASSNLATLQYKQLLIAASSLFLFHFKPLSLFALTAHFSQTVCLLRCLSIYHGLQYFSSQPDPNYNEPPDQFTLRIEFDELLTNRTPANTLKNDKCPASWDNSLLMLVPSTK